MTRKARLSGRTWMPLVAFCVSLLASSVAFAQAWTQSQGSVYFKTSYGTSTASDQFGFDGQVRPYADNVESDAFFDRSLYLYGEGGITDDLTLVISAPYKRVYVRDEDFRYRVRGLGDILIGGRYQIGRLMNFMPARAALSLNLNMTLPTGYTRNYIPTVGNGQIDVTSTIDFGYSFWEIGMYVQGNLGARFRTNAYGLSNAVDCQPGQSRGCFLDSKPDLGDELLSRLEIGYQAQLGGTVLLVQSLNEAVISFSEPDVGFSVREPIPTRRRFIKTGLGLGFYPIREFGVSFQTLFTPWGRNSVRSVDMFIGLETALDFRSL